MLITFIVCGVLVVFDSAVFDLENLGCDGNSRLVTSESEYS